MAFVQIANIKGPRGDEVKNPRLSGDSLLVDEVNRVGSSPVTTTRNLGNVRGRKGDGFSNARVVDGELLIDATDTSGTWTENVGVVQGPQGLPGTGAAVADAAVAGYIGAAGTSETKTALDAYTRPQMDRTQRAALADRIAAWISATARSDRGDELLQGTIRRATIRKTSVASPFLTSFRLEDEEPQGTASGLSLQYLATYATKYPEKADQVRPAIDRLVATIASLQSYDDKQVYFGGVASSAGFYVYGSLSTAQSVKGLILAYERYGVGQWLDMAIKGGAFLRTLANPNPVYQAIYGVDVVEPLAGQHVISERITNTGVLSSVANTWNLVGVHAMYELARVTGDTTWIDSALPVRDFMATALTGRWDYFALKATAAGLAAGRVSETPTMQSSAPSGDNAWHRNGEAGGRGTIESDSMEYALTALWHTGYNLTTLKAAYDYLTGLQMGALTGGGTQVFKDAYNATNRFVCWPGYFRIDDPEAGGGSEAWGGYLDLQGAGELLEWKQVHYPTHYAASMEIIRAAVDPQSGALLNEVFDTVWSVDPNGGVMATRGTVPIAVAGIGLLTTNPDFNLEVTA